MMGDGDSLESEMDDNTNSKIKPPTELNNI